MARIRRVVKKLPPAAEQGFEDRLWPVNVSLLVLGSFLFGSAYAYLKSDAVWWANRLTWMLVIPLGIAGLMIGLRFIGSRRMRRAVQLATVVSILVHVIFLIMSLESSIFSSASNKPQATRDLVEPQRQIVVPEYARHHFVDPQQRPKEDYEKPVETVTPESTPQELARQETQPEPRAREPQPTPVPEPLQTNQPNVVQRQQTAETMPRQSDQSSQLSRRQASATVRPNQTADKPQETPTETSRSAAQPQAQASAVARQSTETPRTSATNAPTPDPANPTAQPTPTVARRDTTARPTPETTAAPTLRRQTAQPQNVPRAATTSADAPVVTQRTTNDPLKPQTTLAQKQTTASPTNQPTTAEATPDASSQQPQTAERRQQPTEARPTIAETPTPIAPQRVRSTSRPDPATVAATATPTPTTVGEARQPVMEASSSAVAHTTPTATATPNRATTDAPANPQATPTVATATPRRSSESTPQATSAEAPSPSMARQANARNPAPSVTTAATAIAAARQTQAEGLAPSSTAMSKQSAAAAEVARASGDPTPATSRSATSNVQVAGPARAATEAATPTTNTTAGTAPGRQSTSATANVVTNAAPVTTNAGPQTTTALAPSATASTVVRQATGAAGPTSSQTPLDAQAASPTTQVAQSGARRTATSAAVPSLDPNAPAGRNPSRTMTTAAAAASPTNVESPAAAIAAAGTGEPTAQPTKVALARGAVGMAGSGASPNLDRTSPAGDRPSLVASGASRRAEATQNSPEGPAFAPSDAPLVRRSVADAARPTGTLKAEAVDYATTGGVAVPTELTASASAALSQASANAAQGATSASKGTVDVDLGPTQIVSERGAARASGGGQPELNFTNPSPTIARSKTGGAPQASIAASEVAAAPVAPAGTSGGAPAAAFQPLATTTVRTMAGGDQPVTGGPTTGQQGPPTEVAAAPVLADAPVSRADASEGAAGSAGGQPVLGNEDEEEKRRRLARAAAGGAPQLALQGPAAIEAPASAATPAGGGPAGQMTGPALVAARTAPAGGPAAPAATAGGVEAPASGGQAAGQLTGPTRVTRSEAVEAAIGAPVAGGGTGSPARAGGGVALAANTQADVPTIAGAPQSGGAPQGSPLEAQGVATARSGEAMRGAPVSGPVGAIAADTVADGQAGGAPGAAVGSRAAAAQASDAPAVGQIAAGGPGPRRAAGGAAAGVGATGPIEVPVMAAEVAQATADHMGPGAGKTETVRQSGGAALTVEVASVDGPGGLGSQATPDVGVNTRRALADSNQVQLRSARFQRQKAGGVLNVSTAAVVPTDPFRGRTTKQSGSEGGNGSPPPQTETSIELGLAFLARYQTPDGSWTLKGFNEEVQLSSDTAATALALLAFQGAGYNHREHKYKDNVRAALDYLVKNQRDDGDLFLPADDESNRSVWLYSHSIAALALCEAYGMTQDPALKEPAQKALDFIVAGQNRERGGWRYAPGVGSDTSVTGWMMMALKSGELSGLKVPPDTYVKIRRWLDSAQGSGGDSHLYRYNPLAPDTETQRHGRDVTKTMTSVGLLMRLYSGWRRDNPNMIRGADYLQQHLPAIGTVRNPQRDTYYWYYATQVMFHMGGKHWEAWNGQLHPLLVNSQIKQGALAGSWEPRGPVPDRWAEHAGRLYVTVMNLLSLEVYYRHLPLYDDTAK